MAVFELVAVDGKTVSADGFDAGNRSNLPAMPETETLEQVRAMRGEIAQVMSAVLAQQAEIAKLNRALSTVRVSRSQELALAEAIRLRSRELAREEAMPGAQKRIAAAIRTTLREATGARAIGDMQAGQFDEAMDIINGWRMPGALRRIRKAMEARP